MNVTRLDDPPVRRKGRLRRLKEVPVLPSLITLGNLFFGFLAIAKVADALRTTAPAAPFSAVVGMFETAAILVFVAMVFDALDGRVARMTGQSTPFGAQLDSMADMVTFGLTPAFLAKVLVDWHAQADGNQLLWVHPKLFFAAAAVYACCAALRLARFNVETSADEEDHREFKGLPSPAAAAVICSLVALFCTRGDKGAELSHRLLGDGGFDWIVVGMPLALVVTGLLMVSRIPFPHAFSALLRGRHSLPFLAVLAVLLIVAAVEWQLALATSVLGYLVWGLGLGLWRFLAQKRDDDDDEPETPVRQAPSRN